MQERWLAAAVKHMDETAVQVLKEPGHKAQTKSYFWIRASDSGPPLRLFSYAPSRSGKTALDFLDGAGGVLMTDGYEAYDKPAELSGLVHLGCWVHARRYFIAVEAALLKEPRGGNHPSMQMIALTGQLYGIEHEATQHRPARPAASRTERACPRQNTGAAAATANDHAAQVVTGRSFTLPAWAMDEARALRQERRLAA